MHIILNLKNMNLESFTKNIRFFKKRKRNFQSNGNWSKFWVTEVSGDPRVKDMQKKMNLKIKFRESFDLLCNFRRTYD